MYGSRQFVCFALSTFLVLSFSYIANGQSIVWNDIQEAVPWLKDDRPYGDERWEKTNAIVGELVARHYKNGAFSDAEIAQLVDEFSGDSLQADWVWYQAFHVFFMTNGLVGDTAFQKTAIRFKSHLLESLKRDRKKAVRFYQFFAMEGWFNGSPALVCQPSLVALLGILKRKYSNFTPNTVSEKDRLTFDALLLFQIAVCFEKSDSFPKMKQLLKHPNLIGKTAGDLDDWHSRNWYNLCLRQDQKTYRNTFLSGKIVNGSGILHGAYQSIKKTGGIGSFGVYVPLYESRLFAWLKIDNIYPIKLPQRDLGTFEMLDKMGARQ